MNPPIPQEGYRKPQVSIDELRILQRLMKTQNPRIGDIKVENLVDSSVVKKTRRQWILRTIVCGVRGEIALSSIAQLFFPIPFASRFHPVSVPSRLGARIGLDPCPRVAAQRLEQQD